MKKVLPLGGRLRLADERTSKSSKVQRSSGGGREGGDEESEEEKVDLRQLLNKNKENSERCVCIYTQKTMTCTYCVFSSEYAD